MTRFRDRDITREMVLSAMAEFDAMYSSENLYMSWRSYAVTHQDRTYPPKHILSLASGLPKNEFSGGAETNRVFEALGFSVVKRTDTSAATTLGPELLEVLVRAYENFQHDPVHAFYVRLRHLRAIAIREILSQPERLDLPTFYHECWHLGELRVDDKKVELSESTLPELERALDEGRLRITGHLVWRQGSGELAPTVKDKEAKLKLVWEACHILTSGAPLEQQVAELDKLRGFGDNLSTGYVMLFHPESYAIYNRRSSAVVKSWGYNASTLEAFQASMATLKDLLGAEDFLELDHFISLVSDGKITLDADPTTELEPAATPAMWWVNQGLTFAGALASESLWAPVKDGANLKHWADVGRLRPGDKVVHYANGYIVASSTVQSEPNLAPNPTPEAGGWSGDGHLVSTRYLRAETPVALNDIPVAWRREQTEGPFTKDGKVKQGYLYPVAPSLAHDLQRFFPELFGRRAYKISPGEGAREWPLWENEGFAALGWNDLGDLRAYETPDALRDAFERFYGEKHGGNASTLTLLSRDLWSFRNLQPGDILVANRGKRQVVAVGVVTGGYEWRPDAGAYAHTVKVEWDATFAAEIPEQSGWSRSFISLEPGWSRIYLLSEPRSRAWIFQANPKLWHLSEKLAGVQPGDAGDWIVSRYRDQMSVGDTVYLWQSGDAAGIYAVGKLTGPVFERSASDWRGTGEEREHAVPFRYTQILATPLSRSAFLGDVVLAEASIIKSPQATNFLLTPEQQYALEALLDAHASAAAYIEPTLNEIAVRVASAGLQIDARTLRRYHAALKTSKFVILSGVSGTGKTWLAQAYAEAIGAAAVVVPVAPNWTSNEDLIGYQNPMQGVYVETEFSRFLRAAAAEHEARGASARPYHLVLDEMNLARVEYYFASFLSAMELRARGGDAQIFLGEEAVRVPPNLIFVGTVNVDETTHAFADKVYDRAQLIELTVDRERVETHLSDRAHASLLLAVWDAVHETAPFAFRVLDEIGRYLEHSDALDVPWVEALDEQLLHKVLPKIKGADLKVGSALTQFLTLANGHGLTLSASKASRMLERYRLDGITSFF